MGTLLGNIIGAWLYDLNDALRKEFFVYRGVRDEVLKARLRKSTRAVID